MCCYFVQRAKPGNPGYGFRRARWRDTLNNAEDRHICETVLKDEGCEEERIKNILTRIQEVSITLFLGGLGRLVCCGQRLWCYISEGYKLTR